MASPYTPDYWKKFYDQAEKKQEGTTSGYYRPTDAGADASHYQTTNVPQQSPDDWRGGDPLPRGQRNRNQPAIDSSGWSGTPNAPNQRPAPTPQADPGGYFPDPAAPPSSPTPPEPESPLSVPGYNENFYKEHGKDLMNPSASEDLYSKGAAGSNPFYDNAEKQTINAINATTAARGNYNSSFALRNIGASVADLRGRQAHELGELAGQADQSKNSRYDSMQRYARSAQDSLEGRAKAGVDAELDAARGRSGLVNPFYKEAGSEAAQAYLANVEVMLKQWGMSQAEVDKAMGELYQSLGIVAKAAA